MPAITNSNVITDAAQIADGIVSNADVAANAAIAYAKLNLAGSIVNADIAANAAIAYAKLNLAGSIVNADIAADAAIADSKLAQIATAGKVSGAALTSLSSIPAGAGQIPSANIGAILALTPGSIQIGASDAEIGDRDDTAYTKRKEIKIPNIASGTVTVDFDLENAAGSLTVYGRIYVNGVAVGTERTRTSAGWQTFSENINVSAGDLVQLYGKRTSGGSFYDLRNFRIKASETPACITIL